MHRLRHKYSYWQNRTGPHYLRKSALAEERGITGLETAIILIAFVMVASVFSYVVLSAGLFSSQKAKEAIYEGIGTAGSSVELRGSVLARVENGVLQTVYFTVASISGGGPIDFTDTTAAGNTTAQNKVVIAYHDSTRQVASTNWTMEKISFMNADNLLDGDELFQIAVDLSPLATNVTAYHTFVLEVKPPNGAILIIERTVPARINQLVNLN
jgi:archaeal flagellin FlaB